MEKIERVASEAEVTRYIDLSWLHSDTPQSAKPTQTFSQSPDRYFATITRRT